MELKFKSVSMKDPVTGEIRNLYEISFPPNERRTFAELEHDFGDKCELLSVLEEARFIGMVILLTLEDITHIMYLAVKPELQDRGYGSRILNLIRKFYPGQRIIADLEDPGENTPNESQREKRISFYQKNGYSFTEINYRWEGENYRIMSNGGNVTWEEFRKFWRYFYPG